jgi:partner of Y14 and mago
MSSSASNKKSETTASGITTNEDGERYIPSSVRPDGSKRKEIKVRPGHTPQEDVATYKNRTAEAWKNKGKGPVPGAETVNDQKENAAASKNAKRREARRRAAAAAGESADKDAEKEGAPVEAQEEKPVDPEAEKAKEVRKLTKKLRQARELKDKKDKGDTLLPEQFEKVIRINELIRQLELLGFDPNGERKADET